MSTPVGKKAYPVLLMALAGAVLIALLLLASLPGAEADRVQPQAKLDPMLRLLLVRNEQSLARSDRPLNLAQYADVIGVYDGVKPIREGPRQAGKALLDSVNADHLGVLVQFQGSAAALAETGAELGVVVGNIATARVTLEQLAEIAALPTVVQVAASYRRQPVGEVERLVLRGDPQGPALDLSVPETGADALHDAGIDGSGVIVGLVDTGIDWDHLDLRTGGAGEPESRILYLWDQWDSWPAPGPPLPPFYYGTLWTKADIESDIANGCPTPPSFPDFPVAPCQVRHLDFDGHGTHVIGTAAGDGSSSAAGYVGMAPGADIIAVATTFFDFDIINGVAFIFQQAAALGQPAVVNLSLGGQYGPHDGTDLFDQAMDLLVEESSQAPGRAIVVAAGNEADLNIHAGGDVPNGGSLDVIFTHPLDAFAQDFGSDVFDFWSDSATPLCVRVITPGGTTVPAAVDPPVCPGELADWSSDPALVTADGCIFIDNASFGPNPLNNANELITWVDGPGWGCPNPAANGDWTYRFEPQGGGAGGRIDGWNFYMVIPNEFNPPAGDNSMTVGSPGTANTVITVGSYATRDCWDVDGDTTDDYCTGDFFTPAPAVTEGDISFFSSLGPTRDGRTKPEIAAPGHWIASTLAEEAEGLGIPTEFVVPDGQHAVLLGTSMATPHVVGAVALILQQNPALTADEIKTLLQDKALADTFTGTVPNNTWGWGKLQAPQVGILGDVDCDGELTIVDALLIAQLVVGLITDVPCPDVADVDGSGEVDIVDALLVAQTVVALI